MEVVNDEILDAGDAALINSLAGTNFVAGDILDFMGISGDAFTSGGGLIQVGLSLALDSRAVDDENPGNYPPNSDDILFVVFEIIEVDDQFQEIYAAQGVLDDSDSDGIPDGIDNCPTDFNLGQLDTDGDGLGNVCDDNGSKVPVSILILLGEDEE